MNEIAVKMGRDQNLIGVMTLPEKRQANVAVVLLNAGVVHRIGPHRISVKIARHLAKLGFATIRFDITGIGDSRSTNSALDFSRQAVQDTKSVMDYLQSQYGYDQFAIYGICSGAMNGYAAALADDRVTGLFMYDGYAFATTKAKFIRNWFRIQNTSLKKYLELHRRLYQRIMRLLLGKQDARVLPSLVSEFQLRLTKDRFADGLQLLADRGLALVSVYSGSIFETYNYATQFQDAFKGRAFLDKVVCYYIPEMDHLVTALAVQDRLTRLVAEWVQQTSQRSVAQQD